MVWTNYTLVLQTWTSVITEVNQCALPLTETAQILIYDLLDIKTTVNLYLCT